MLDAATDLLDVHRVHPNLHPADFDIGAGIQYVVAIFSSGFTMIGGRYLLLQLTCEFKTFCSLTICSAVVREEAKSNKDLTLQVRAREPFVLLASCHR